MKTLRTDLAIFRKFKFKRPPVGIKFSFFKPAEMESLPQDRPLSLCEVLGEAQTAGKSFYFGKDYGETCVGKILLGMKEMVPFAESGQIGENLRIFQEARANYAFYQHVPKFERNVVNYVAFAPIENLAFEPDLLILTADHRQAEIVLRSMTFSSGELYNSRTTPVMGCAWLLIYPFKSGKVNFIIPELIHGMKGREVFPPDSVVISIPYHWLPTMARNLEEMPWSLPSHESKKQYLDEFQTVLGELIEKSRNP
jgi:uncharacterized protein (DUF169 family)